jgi:hypothetical protein
MDSLSFVVDHTRGRMRYYPFYDQNFKPGTSEAMKHDIAIFHRLSFQRPYIAVQNPLNTISYWPPIPYTKIGSCSYVPELDSTSPNYDTVVLDFSIWIRPPLYSLSSYFIMSERTYAPAGYEVDGLGAVIGYLGGIPHTYILDTFIDLTIINPHEKRIYNPSETIIEADSFVFPSGYTFLTTRGLYPTATEVY